MTEILALDHVRLAMPAGAEKCRTAGFPPVTDEPLAGYDRVYVFDPFGNRLELLEPI